MKRVLLVAVCVMACLCGIAQEVGKDTTYLVKPELGVTASGKKVQVWDIKIDDVTGDVSYVMYVEDAKAGELWSLCRMWLAENVKEYNRTKQIEDKQEGRLVVNFNAPVEVRAKDGKFDTRWLGIQTWKMTIQCKDERFRVKMTEYTSQWNAQFLQIDKWSRPLPQINKSYGESAMRMGDEIFIKQYRNTVADVIILLGEYLKKASEEDDDF